MFQSEFRGAKSAPSVRVRSNYRPVVKSASSRQDSDEHPEVCIYYNMEKGCSRGEKCWFLHLCRYYVSGECKFKGSCKRSHDPLDRHNYGVLQDSGMDVRRRPEEILADLKGMNQGPNNAGDASGTSGKAPPIDDEEKEICIFNLRGQCGFGTNCRLHHKPAPFQWQYKDGASWVDCKVSEAIERQYCMVDKVGVTLSLQIAGKPAERRTIDFDSMTTVGLMPVQIRRLGTVSSVLKPASFEYVTKWHWYWLDENQKWRLYGYQEDTHVQTDISVNEIEEEFLSGTSNMAFSTTAGHKYDLDFNKMQQMNLKIGTRRKIRRRPEFIDWTKKPKGETESASKAVVPAEKSAILGFMSSLFDWGKKPTGGVVTASGTSPEKTNVRGAESASKAVFPVGKLPQQSLVSSYIPENWSTDRLNQTVQYIKLNKSSSEFKATEGKFKVTMPGHEVTSINRVQSLEIFDAYYRKKTWMKRHSKNEPKELTLFHATRKENMKAICEQGFDCRISGSRTGTAYGKGTYFARRAKTAAHYCDGENKFLFVCKVLVGESCQGMSHYVRPPPKNPNKPKEDFFDSCVDNPADPKIYVIFRPEQAYPEHILFYK